MLPLKINMILKGEPVYWPLFVPQSQGFVAGGHIAKACTAIVKPLFVMISLVIPVFGTSLTQLPLNAAAGATVAVALALA